MDQSQGSDSDVVSGTRKFLSPNRILVRSFRLSRDTWKEKHQLTQAKLEKERQLSAERGRSRDQWKAKCDLVAQQAHAAELLAQERLAQLQLTQDRLARCEAELKKKSGPPDSDLIPVGGSTPVSIIGMVRQFIAEASLSLRAIPRVTEIFARCFDRDAITPSASAARWWLQRLGLFSLRETLTIADDWFYLIDHSIQIGTVKLCVIVGLRLSQLPSPARPLRLEDLHLLGLHPTEKSTGEIVLGQLEQAVLRTGIPRGIASDHGSDVKKGSELFAAQHPQTAVVYDAAHHGAVVLKRKLEADDRWAQLITLLGQTKARLLQTSDAYLVSPSLRLKARYMNIESLLRWCRRILALLSRWGKTNASQRARVRYGWLEKFRGAIGEWSRWESTIRCSVALIRTQGLSRDSQAQLKAAFRARPSRERHKELEAGMLEFVRQQSAGLKADVRLIGSTEVLESLFGKLKTLERQESKSGLTGLVLSLGSLLGTWTNSRLKEALDQTPVKHVESWLKKLFPQSVQSQRRLAFAASEP